MIPLDQKFKRYRNMLTFQQDEYGFIDSDRCDSLLFTSLAGCVEGVDPKIDMAQGFEGYWHRRPFAWTLTHQCYNPEDPANQEGVWAKLFRIVSHKIAFPALTWAEIFKANWYTGSTISRDMLIGLAWYCYHNNRLDIAENIVKTALYHFGVMGKGDPARTNIMPPLLATFAWISYRLGGPSRPWLRWIPVGTGGKLKGFQAHLEMLHLMLRERLMGHCPKSYSKTYRYHTDREPNNPLFAIAAGDAGRANAILKWTNLWPEDRLPTNRDRSEGWLPQRDYGTDWLPDTDAATERTHSGGDFLFCWAMLVNQLKKM